jgi:hypothetical protein
MLALFRRHALTIGDGCALDAARSASSYDNARSDGDGGPPQSGFGSSEACERAGYARRRAARIFRVLENRVAMTGRWRVLLGRRNVRRRPSSASQRHDAIGQQQSCRCKRQPDAKRCATAGPIFSPYPTAVCFGDGSRDRQPHSHSLRLGGEEWSKNFLEPVRRDTGPSIGNGRFHKIFRVARGSVRSLAFRAISAPSARAACRTWK